ncbi:hypothetical protein E5676_scaffold832G001670 [Cucumis melo var. makuwa]|uniref:Uncharacterized protein n=1 Tax=Cucumis melo var. makuwa TaxID=1194695 RepID=A0A5D3CQ23_CUCMM|nr:hypothetical protein E6C27_scaffold379G00140 [Cucumis melo var. makuwa]TYK13963.1 hypothetical protein E5676_scaffold832G001670 [Cucumis melo var. makuwa]
MVLLSKETLTLGSGYILMIVVVVQEEERQALAAADIDAVKDAIATIEVSRKTIPTYPESRNPIFKSLSTMEGSCITSERGSYNIKYVTFMIVNIRKVSSHH